MHRKRGVMLISLLEEGLIGLLLLLKISNCKPYGIEVLSLFYAAVILGVGIAALGLYTYFYIADVEDISRNGFLNYGVFTYGPLAIIVCCIVFLSLYCLERISGVESGTYMQIELGLGVTVVHLLFNRRMMAG